MPGAWRALLRDRRRCRVAPNRPNWLRCSNRHRPRLLWAAGQDGWWGLDQWQELIVVTHARRQLMRHDDLRFSIDGGLGVISLDVTVLGQKDAAVGVGEVALCLAIRLRVGRRRSAAVFLASR